MSKIILSLLSLFVLGCGVGGNSGSASPVSSAPNGPSLSSSPVEMKSGRAFSCFSLNETVWCAGSAPGIVSSVAFVPLASFAQTISRLEVFDDTVCAETTVVSRPVSGSSGVATYCWGEASLGPNYAGYPVIYSPPFGPANIPSGASFASLPFVGGDTGMGLFTDEGGIWLVMIDSRGLVSRATISCDTDGTNLICPAFSLVL